MAIGSVLVTGMPCQAERFGMVTVQNEKPRIDQDGKIIDAHDGCLQFFAGRYYLYGTAYGKTAGYAINNRFRVYSSVDLEHWTFEGELLKEPLDGVYYRPYVAYNARTRKYVLWYNWYEKLWDGKVGVATSDSPTGPFTIANTSVLLSQEKDYPGDGSLFVDDDGTAFFIYTTIGQNHSIRIEKLTADYLSTAGEVSDSLGVECEAPAMFRRKNLYYAVFDRTCCFCRNGSGARVLVATSPLGPYKEIGNINRTDTGKPIISAQQTYVARIPTSHGTDYVWMGDLWKSRTDGVKGHDLQYWSAPLQFNPDGSIVVLAPTSVWKERIEIGKRRRGNLTKRYEWPQKHDPQTLRTDACYQTPLNEDGEPVSGAGPR
jgi:hypothetical protein